MKIRFVAVLVMVTCLLAGSLYSVPGNPTEATQFLSRHDQVIGQKFVDNTNTFFIANTHDDLKGVAQGDVTISSEDNSTGRFHSISCSGPAYANILSVNKVSGDVSVNATLNPASPGCFSSTDFAPVTVSISGQFNGILQTSQTGIATNTSDGMSFKSNVSTDFFTETFTGTVGFASGPFSGNATTTRSNQRTRVK
jgi:hypothetical protein